MVRVGIAHWATKVYQSTIRLLPAEYKIFKSVVLMSKKYNVVQIRRRVISIK